MIVVAGTQLEAKIEAQTMQRPLLYLMVIGFPPIFVRPGGGRHDFTCEEVAHTISSHTVWHDSVRRILTGSQPVFDNSSL